MGGLLGFCLGSVGVPPPRTLFDLKTIPGLRCLLVFVVCEKTSQELF